MDDSPVSNIQMNSDCSNYFKRWQLHTLINPRIVKIYNVREYCDSTLLSFIAMLMYYKLLETMWRHTFYFTFFTKTMRRRNLLTNIIFTYSEDSRFAKFVRWYPNTPYILYFKQEFKSNWTKQVFSFLGIICLFIS